MTESNGRRLGITVPLEGVAVSQAIEVAKLAEDSGFTDAWSAEVGGADGLTVLAATGARCPSLRLGTAILPVFSRPPALLAMSAASLQTLTGGRFTLGIGTSTSIIVGEWMGQKFERPYTRMKETIAFLRQALTGKKVEEAYSTFRSKGFRLTAPSDEPVPIHIAALGPRMLALAGTDCDGVILFLFTPEGAKGAIDAVRDAARKSGRDPSSVEVVARIPVALNEDKEFLEFMLRRLTAGYAMVDVYAASLARQGFSEESETIARLWREGDRDGAAAAVTDEMLQRLYVYGDEERCAMRIREFRDAGIDTPILLPVSVSGDPHERLEKIRAAVPLLAGV